MHIPPSPLVQQCLRRIRLSCPQISADSEFEDRFGRWLSAQAARNHSRGRTPEGYPCDPSTDIPDEYIDEIIYYFLAEGPLVAALKNRHHQAWAKMLVLINGRVHTNVRRHRSQHLNLVAPIDDLVQHCASLIWQSLERYPFDTRLEAWLSRFVFYEVHAWYRTSEARRSRQLVYLDQPVLSAPGESATLGEQLPDERTASAIWRTEWRIAFEAGIASALTPDQGEVLQRRLSGQSQAEIAQYMRRTPNAVYKLHQRAIAALRDFLSQASHDPRSRLA